MLTKSNRSRSLLETLESRRLLSVTAPADYVLVQGDIAVDSDGTPTQTGIMLDSGANYFVKATGTYTIAPGRLADAEFMQENSAGHPWIKGVKGRPLVAGVTDWGDTRDTSTTPEYGGFFTGIPAAGEGATGSEFTPRLNDTYYNDNAGGLTLELYRQVPTVSVERIQDGAEDANTPAIFRVSRTGSTSGELAVNFFLGGTATAGQPDSGQTMISETADYQAPPSSQVVIPASESFADLVLPVFNDPVDDGEEGVTLTLSDSYGYVVAAVAREDSLVIRPLRLREARMPAAPKDALEQTLARVAALEQGDAIDANQLRLLRETLEAQSSTLLSRDLVDAAAVNEDVSRKELDALTQLVVEISPVEFSIVANVNGGYSVRAEAWGIAPQFLLGQQGLLSAVVTPNDPQNPRIQLAAAQWINPNTIEAAIIPKRTVENGRLIASFTLNAGGVQWSFSHVFQPFEIHEAVIIV